MFAVQLTHTPDQTTAQYLSLSRKINDGVCAHSAGLSPLGLVTRLVQEQLDRSDSSTASNCDVGVSASTQG